MFSLKAGVGLTIDANLGAMAYRCGGSAGMQKRIC